MNNSKLTGRIRHRRNWFGALVLWVEEERQDSCAFDGSLSPKYRRWRRAQPADLDKLYITCVPVVHHWL